MSGAITAAVAGAVVGGGLSIMAANKSASAAKSAASTSAKAADAAAQAQLEQYYQTRTDTMPWLTHGMQGNNLLSGLLGLSSPEELAQLEHTYRKENLIVGTDYMPTRENFDFARYRVEHPGVSTASDDKVWAHYQKHYNANEGGFIPSDAALTSVLPDMTDLTSKYTTIINSVTGGKTGGLLASFTPEDLTANLDPGYEWRKSQGEKSLLAASAASGMYGSGNMATALTDYGQNQASAEYQNAWNRWNADRNNVYNMVAGVSGTGQTAATTLGNTGANATNAASGYNMTGANAVAQGYINSAAATNSGYQGINNAFQSGLGTYMNYSQNQNLLNALQNNIATTMSGPRVAGYRKGGRPPLGTPVIVGEEGPELFVADRPGTIIPNHQISRARNMLKRGRRALPMGSGR